MIFPSAYMTFLIMLTTDVSDLMSTTISDTEIDSVQKRLIETVALKELLFSDSLSLIIYHQLLHLSQHIRLSGPVGANTNLWGERMNLKLKIEKATGGSDDAGTIVRRSLQSDSNAERIFDQNDITQVRSSFLNKVKRFYNPATYTYTEYPFELVKPEKKPIGFKPDELHFLIKALLREVVKQTTSLEERLIRSTLFRVYITMKSCFLPGKTMESIAFIPELAALISNGQGNSLPHGIVVKKKSEVNSRQYVLEEQYKNTVILEDLSAVASFFNSVVIPYRQGIIYGERFNCRGSSCSEKVFVLGQITNKFNNLLDNSTQSKEKDSCNENGNEDKDMKNECDHERYVPNCITKKNYGSWAMIRDAGSNYEDITIGQLNYFFRVTIITDSILYNIPFASIVLRHFRKEHTTLYCIDLNDSENFNQKNYFTAATNIVPTVMGVGFVDEDQNACIIASARHLHQSDLVIKQYSDTNIPATIKLVPMNLNRLNIKYNFDANHIYNAKNK